MSIVFSFLVSALFFMALGFAVLQVKRWGKFWPVAYLLLGIALVIPLEHWLLIEFVRGYLSDLSVASIFLLVAYLINTVNKTTTIEVSPSLKVTIVLIGLFIYPMSMGLTQFDPFAMGYPSNALNVYLLSACLVIGLVAWSVGSKQITAVLTVSLLMYGLSIYESDNLWTYIIDPVAVIICLFSLIKSSAYYVYNRTRVSEG